MNSCLERLLANQGSHWSQLLYGLAAAGFTNIHIFALGDRCLFFYLLHNNLFNGWPISPRLFNSLRAQLDNNQSLLYKHIRYIYTASLLFLLPIYPTCRRYRSIAHSITLYYNSSLFHVPRLPIFNFHSTDTRRSTRTWATTTTTTHSWHYFSIWLQSTHQQQQKHFFKASWQTQRKASFWSKVCGLLMWLCMCGLGIYFDTAPCSAPCYIQQLSIEVLAHVFARLDPTSLATVGGVCRFWRHIVMDDTCCTYVHLGNNTSIFNHIGFMYRERCISGLLWHIAVQAFT